MNNQLKFDNDFSSLKFDINIKNVPNYILNRIKYISDNRYLKDKNNNFYCSNCFHKLNDFYCNICGKKYEDNERYHYEIENISDFKYSCGSFSFSHVVFDVVDNLVFLYIIEECDYYQTDSYLPSRKITFNVDKLFNVLKDKVIDVEDNTEYKYSDLDIINQKLDKYYDKLSELDYEEFEKIDNGLTKLEEKQNDIFNNAIPDNLVYIDSVGLNKLKESSLYKYTNIWETEEYLKKCFVSLAKLTYYPLHFKQFEYLIKLGFYEMAIESCNRIKPGKSFTDTFGVDKKYYDFMKEVNIPFYALDFYKKYPTTDIELYNFYTVDLYISEKISEITDIRLVKEYFDNKELSKDIDNIYMYYDYLTMIKDAGYDLKDKKVLFPSNLEDNHNKLALEMELTKNPEVIKKIKDLSKLLAFNIYEDDKYIIFPANSIESLFEESKMQKNCVRIYGNRIANNECQIYFMRSKLDKDRSLVTIEVRNNKVVQAKVKFNQKPSDDLMKVIKKWEKTLIEIQFQ